MTDSMSRATHEAWEQWLAKRHRYLCNTPTERGLSVILEWLTEIGWTPASPGDAPGALPPGEGDVVEEPTVWVTEYEVSILPRDHIDAGHFTITVAWRGNDRWAVTRHKFCLGSDGEWDYEMQPSSRVNKWLATHRFPLDEALRLAKQAAPDIKVNGRTARQALALSKQTSS